jgi:hypothetical protein
MDSVVEWIERVRAQPLYAEVPTCPSDSKAAKDLVRSWKEIAEGVSRLGRTRRWRVIAALVGSDSVDDLQRVNRIVSRWPGSRATETLLRLAHDPREDVSERAWSSLAFQAGPSSLNFFRSVIQHPETSAKRRDDAIEFLADAFDMRKRHARFDEAVRLIAMGLDDPSPEVRWTSAFALGKLRARMARKALARHQDDPMVSERYGRVHAIVRAALKVIDHGGPYITPPYPFEQA